MIKTIYCLAALLCALYLLDGSQNSARAADQGIVATVNDIPITSFDIDQRLRLLEILGQKQETSDARKKALHMMIDEVIKIAEATKYKVNATDKEIEAQMGRLAKGLQTDAAGLRAKLQSQGIAIASLKQYVAAQISFARVLSGKYQVKIKVEPAEVDKKSAQIKQDLEQKVSTIMKDPRMKSVQVYNILEIDLPVEVEDSMLLQARAVEAVQLIRNFKGCSTARAAASGIFNVKIGKPIDAVATKIPKPMKQALDKIGPGKAMGPARGPKGIQVIGFCSKRTIQPPKPKYELPTRQQVQTAVSNEKYDAAEEKYMKILRKAALIEYKDPAYAPS
ncbi:MAG TPA: SurA N-terminal domain-containing protein [Aestuariivirga sp.]|nr:SurA N-terminal domain-containing protein [Aestuariivirga sp.]